jgi:hypothetical protein
VVIGVPMHPIGDDDATARVSLPSDEQSLHAE